MGPSTDGHPIFADVTLQSGLGGAYNTFTCWFWDYNNDGHEDILAAGFNPSSFDLGKSISHDFGKEMLGMEHGAQTGILFENNGNGKFSNVSKAVGLDKILYMMGAILGTWTMLVGWIFTVEMAIPFYDPSFPIGSSGSMVEHLKKLRTKALAIYRRDMVLPSRILTETTIRTFT